MRMRMRMVMVVGCGKVEVAFWVLGTAYSIGYECTAPYIYIVDSADSHPFAPLMLRQVLY